jgi:hypothetical protein
MVESIEQLISSGRIQGRLQADRMLGQILNGTNPPDAIKDQFKKASSEFAVAMEPPWNSKEFVDVWYGYYGTHFTDEELDQLLSNYTSPLGQKEVKVSREAMPL